MVDDEDDDGFIDRWVGLRLWDVEWEVALRVLMVVVLGGLRY